MTSSKNTSKYDLYTIEGGSRESQIKDRDPEGRQKHHSSIKPATAFLRYWEDCAMSAS